MRTKILIGLIALTISGCNEEETIETCYNCKTVTYITDSSTNTRYSLPTEYSKDCGVTNSGIKNDTGLFQFEHPIVKDSILTIQGSKQTVKTCN